MEFRGDRAWGYYRFNSENDNCRNIVILNMVGCHRGIYQTDTIIIIIFAIARELYPVTEKSEDLDITGRA